VLAAAAALFALCGDQPDSSPANPAAAASEDPAQQQSWDDPLPPGSVMRLGTLRFQVSSEPFRLLSLPGGKAYLGYHRAQRYEGPAELRWMDAETGKVTDSWRLPLGRVLISVSPDARWAILYDEVRFTQAATPFWQDKPAWRLTAYLYDLSRKQQVQTLQGEIERSEQAFLRCLCSSGDGKWLATGPDGEGYRGRVRLWSTQTGKQVWASDWDKGGASEPLSPLGFTPDNAELILRGAKDNRIRVVNVVRRAVVRDFSTVTPGERSDARLFPDGTVVLIYGKPSQVRIWDVKRGKERPAPPGPWEGTRNFAFSLNGNTLVTRDNDGCVLVRDWPSGSVHKQIDLGRSVQDLFVTADGRTLTVQFYEERERDPYGADRRFHRYDLKTGKALPFPADALVAEVDAVEAAPDGSVLSLGRDNLLRTWDPASGRQRRAVRLERISSTKPFSLGPGGNLAAVDGAKVVIFDRDTGQALREIAAPIQWLDGVIFSPDGQWLAGTGGEAHTLLVWDACQGKKVFETQIHTEGWWAGAPYAFSPDGRSFATLEEREVRFWQVGTWKPDGALPIHAHGLAFSPDGRMLACAGSQDVTVWDVGTRARLLEHHSEAWYPVQPRFSPDGRHFGYLERMNWHEQALEVVEIPGGRPVARFAGHDGKINAWTFLPDGKRLVTASEDCTLLVWDLNVPVSRFKPPVEPAVAELRIAWHDLAATGGWQVFAAPGTLARGGDRSVALIRERLRPIAPPDATEVRRLLAALDSDHFKERDQAALELRAMGEAAEGHLRKFLNSKPSPEAALQARELLEGLPATRRRQTEAVKILEQIGTDAARDALRRLAGGDPDAPLTIEVKAALGRLGP
jgi:WD40 repeat protein